MRVICFSQDQELKNIFAEHFPENYLFTDKIDEIIVGLSQNDLNICFFEYELNTNAVHDFNKQYNAQANIKINWIIPPVSPKKLREFQNSDLNIDAFLPRPLDKEMIIDIIGEYQELWGREDLTTVTSDRLTTGSAAKLNEDEVHEDSITFVTTPTSVSNPTDTKSFANVPISSHSSRSRSGKHHRHKKKFRDGHHTVTNLKLDSEELFDQESTGDKVEVQPENSTPPAANPDQQKHLDLEFDLNLPQLGDLALEGTNNAIIAGPLPANPEMASDIPKIEDFQYTQLPSSEAAPSVKIKFDLPALKQEEMNDAEIESSLGPLEDGKAVLDQNALKQMMDNSTPSINLDLDFIEDKTGFNTDGELLPNLQLANEYNQDTGPNSDALSTAPVEDAVSLPTEFVSEVSSPSISSFAPNETEKTLGFDLTLGNNLPTDLPIDLPLDLSLSALEPTSNQDAAVNLTMTSVANLEQTIKNFEFTLQVDQLGGGLSNYSQISQDSSVDRSLDPNSTMHTIEQNTLFVPPADTLQEFRPAILPVEEEISFIESIDEKNVESSLSSMPAPAPLADELPASLPVARVEDQLALPSDEQVVLDEANVVDLYPEQMSAAAQPPSPEKVEVTSNSGQNYQYEDFDLTAIFIPDPSGQEQGISASSRPENGDSMLVRNTSKAHSATNDFPSHSEKIREVIAAQFPAKHTKIAFDATAQFSGDQRISSIEREHYNAALETLRHHQDELLNLSSIIKNLREEREILLNDLEKLKDAQQSGARMQLNHKAQAEEAKIELSILKRRYFEDIEDYKNKLRVSEERKMMYESKIKEYQKEFENLEQSVRTDFHRVKNREKELESQLELIKHDAESQINSRDQKILELKRKIDALEFNMENVMIKEKKSKDDKVQMEEKFDKVIRNLKGSIRLLEEDLAAERAVRRKIDEIKY